MGFIPPTLWNKKCDNMQELNVNDIEEAVNSNEWLLLDFWAEWCGPCKMMAPVVNELAEEMKEKIHFSKLEMDKNPDSAQKYGITTVPTFIILHNGEIVDKITGTQSKESLKKRIIQAQAP